MVRDGCFFMKAYFDILLCVYYYRVLNFSTKKGCFKVHINTYSKRVMQAIDAKEFSRITSATQKQMSLTSTSKLNGTMHFCAVMILLLLHVCAANACGGGSGKTVQLVLYVQHQSNNAWVHWHNMADDSEKRKSCWPDEGTDTSAVQLLQCIIVKLYIYYNSIVRTPVITLRLTH